ncbi:MAG: phosphatase PAP2 family protein [Chitinophagaceae bacterium]|nr:phosphatase PAP2 family protein [Chitinophagaceae bacterium]
MIIRYFLYLALLFECFFASAQPDSIPPPPRQDKPNVTSLIVPATLTAYGFAALKFQVLKDLDRNIREEIWFDHPHGRTTVDNYLQYAPAAAVYILNAAGVKGRHDLLDRTTIYIMANAIMAIPVLSLKKVINAPRPDGSGNDGFPSGHVATAFVAAEFLRQEFKDRSPWYGVAGYTTAAATGFLRVYNDKHWFSELLAGAGIGMISARAAYWLFPAVKKKLFKQKTSVPVAIP